MKVRKQKTIKQKQWFLKNGWLESDKGIWCSIHKYFIPYELLGSKVKVIKVNDDVFGFDYQDEELLLYKKEWLR